MDASLFDQSTNAWLTSLRANHYHIPAAQLLSACDWLEQHECWAPLTKVVHKALQSPDTAQPQLLARLARSQHLDTQLMAEDAWIFDEWHLPQVAADVRAADADGTNGDERFSRRRRGGFR